MLKKRVITAICLLPLLVVTVWFDKPIPWLTIFVAVWGLLAALEFYNIVAASNQKVEPLTSFGLVWTLLFILSPHLDHTYLNPLLLTSAVVLPPVWLLLREQKEGAFLSWAWTVAGILYIGWLLSHFVALRGLEFGRDWVLFTLFITFTYDSAAYFVGRAWGRHRLAPSISPGKSWEGTIGGLIAAIGISLLLVWLLDLPLSYGQTIPLAILVSVFGQIGDLFESMFKRNMGVKDSGKGVPGHGGFLDRMDSVVFAVVVVYYYVILVIN
jgi:phosphatidate cytidylyltransferase